MHANLQSCVSICYLARQFAVLCAFAFNVLWANLLSCMPIRCLACLCPLCSLWRCKPLCPCMPWLPVKSACLAARLVCSRPHAVRIFVHSCSPFGMTAAKFTCWKECPRWWAQQEGQVSLPASLHVYLSLKSTQAVHISTACACIVWLGQTRLHACMFVVCLPDWVDPWHGRSRPACSTANL